VLPRAPRGGPSYQRPSHGAIDVSVGSARAIAVVAARGHILKSRSFQRASTWAKHFRELGSYRKRTYLAAFPRRFEKTKMFLELARVCPNARCAQDPVDRYSPVVVLADDELYNTISHGRKIVEDSAADPVPVDKGNAVALIKPRQEAAGELRTAFGHLSNRASAGPFYRCTGYGHVARLFGAGTSLRP